MAVADLGKRARPAPVKLKTSTKTTVRDSIGPLIARQRIMVVVGAGGVGKTTMAAAMAVRAARCGRRVACLTIDPARRLADRLGIADSLPEERIKDVTHILGNEVFPGGRLWFGMLDPKHTFDAMVKRRASSPAVARKILTNRIYRYLSGSLSGIHEYMALEALCELEAQSEIDLIVLDTPPTANAIDFFTAPRRMGEALDGRLVRIMRRAYEGPGRVGFNLLSRSASALLKAISRVTGAELLDEMLGFIDALSDLFGGLAEQARHAEDVLKGRDVTFCLVTSPEKSTLEEAEELREEMNTMGLRVDAVLFNRTHWPPVDAPPLTLDPEVRREMERLNARWNRSLEAERTDVEAISRTWTELEAVVRVPIIPDNIDRVLALDRMGQYL